MSLLILNFQDLSHAKHVRQYQPNTSALEPGGSGNDLEIELQTSIATGVRKAHQWENQVTLVQEDLQLRLGIQAQRALESHLC